MIKRLMLFVNKLQRLVCPGPEEVAQYFLKEIRTNLQGLRDRIVTVEMLKNNEGLTNEQRDIIDEFLLIANSLRLESESKISELEMRLALFKSMKRKQESFQSIIKKTEASVQNYL